MSDQEHQTTDAETVQDDVPSDQDSADTNESPADSDVALTVLPPYYNRFNNLPPYICDPRWESFPNSPQAVHLVELCLEWRGIRRADIKLMPRAFAHLHDAWEYADMLMTWIYRPLPGQAEWMRGLDHDVLSTRLEGGEYGVVKVFTVPLLVTQRGSARTEPR